MAGVGQQKGQEARRDDSNGEMGHLSSAFLKMVTNDWKNVMRHREEMMVAVRRNHRAAKRHNQEQLRWAEGWIWGECEQWAGAGGWAQRIWDDFHTSECSN